MTAMGIAMAEPFLWGSQINLPAGLRNPHVTALSNGTFLVLSRIGTQWEESGFKAWVYNADGTLKEEKTLDVPSDYATEANATDFDQYVSESRRSGTAGWAHRHHVVHAAQQ